jgi:hypothetical protein
MGKGDTSYTANDLFLKLAAVETHGTVEIGIIRERFL